MAFIDSRSESNYREYLQLQQNSDYYNVTFDKLSGGISAIHKEHCFDKQVGPFGCPRGQYELDVVNILCKNGHSILLESEYPKGKRIKSYDAVIDGSAAEIKTVESNGRWSIRTKIHSAIHQGAETLVLYYPEAQYYSIDKIIEGWRRNTPPGLEVALTRILALVERDVLEIIKPPG